MIDGVDQHLLEWVEATLGPMPVSLDPPTSTDGEAVNIYLLEVVPSEAVRGRGAPVEVALRYLVSATGRSTKSAHALLGTLALAAAEHGEWELEAGPVPLAIWTAFKVAPRPAFMLRVPLRRTALVVARAKPVLEPIRAVPATMAVLEGVVLGPGKVPLVDARVELGATRMATRTDGKGRFRFVAVPAAPAAKVLSVRAKGREQRFTAELDPSGKPIELQFDLTEG